MKDISTETIVKALYNEKLEESVMSKLKCPTKYFSELMYYCKVKSTDNYSDFCVQLSNWYYSLNWDWDSRGNYCEETLMFLTLINFLSELYRNDLYVIIHWCHKNKMISKYEMAGFSQVEAFDLAKVSVKLQFYNPIISDNEVMRILTNTFGAENVSCSLQGVEKDSKNWEEKYRRLQKEMCCLKEKHNHKLIEKDEQYGALDEEYNALKGELYDCRQELDIYKAQIDIVKLIFGGNCHE